MHTSRARTAFLLVVLCLVIAGFSSPSMAAAPAHPQLGLPYSPTLNAIQVWQDNQWEVKLYGQGELVLASSPANEIQPRISPDCSRLAFVSDRAKNYNIYVVGLDGSDLREIIHYPGADVNPSWTPDGKGLIFASNMSGNYEIYQVDLATLQVQALTNDIHNDTQPAWSPDGSKIAFISDRNGIPLLFTMNPDGSEVKVISSQPNSQLPVWSPDSRQIAYSADADEDQYRELWITQADGLNQRLLAKSNWIRSDLLASAWTVDNLSIVASEVQWNSDNGNVFWYSAKFKSISPAGGQLQDWFINGTKNWQVHQVKCDFWPPVTTPKALPEYSHESIHLDWKSEDPGEAGLLDYEVQVKAGDGAWETWDGWRNQYLVPHGTYEGTPGTKYTFRIRGIDRTLNVEAWPENGLTVSSTIYRWSLAGSVSDMAGGPVGGANVMINPPAIHAVQTGKDGNYQAWVGTQADQYTVGWKKAGYNPSTGMTLPHAVQIFSPVALPPTDNRLPEGTFENSGLPASWQSYGTYTTSIVNTAAYLGQQSLRLGTPPNPPFGDPVIQFDIRPDTYELIAGQGGNFHTIWEWGNQIYYQHWDAQGGWDAQPEPIVGIVTSSLPMLVVDPRNDQPLLGWVQSDRFALKRRGADGVWTDTEFVSGDFNGVQALWLRVNADGVVHFLWNSSTSASPNIYYRQWRPEQGWQAIERPLVYYTHSWEGEVQPVVDSEGGVHFLFGLRGCWSYYTRGPKGGWSSLDQLIPCSRSTKRVRLLIDSADTLHAVWDTGSPEEMFYTQKPAGKPWQPSEKVGPSNGGRLVVDPQNQPYICYVGNVLTCLRRVNEGAWEASYFGYVFPVGLKTYDMAASPEGGVDLAYYWPYNDGGIFLAHMDPEGHATTRLINTTVSRFDEPINLSASGNNLQIQMVDDTTKHLVTIGPQRLDPGATWVQRNLTLPSGSPALAFELNVSGLSPENGSAFSVTLQAGSVASPLMEWSQNMTGWQHQWFDLTPWAGQNVTLTWGLRQGASFQPAVARLDEVMVGTSYPSLWVRWQNQAPVSLDKPFNWVLHYANAGSPSDNTRLAVTIPAGLNLVAAEGEPAINGNNLTWELGTLAHQAAGSIFLTLQAASGLVMPVDASITANITSTTQELEMADNTATLKARMAWFLFLPSVYQNKTDPSGQ